MSNVKSVKIKTRDGHVDVGMCGATSMLTIKLGLSEFQSITTVIDLPKEDLVNMAEAILILDREDNDAS